MRVITKLTAILNLSMCSASTAQRPRRTCGRCGGASCSVSSYRTRTTTSATTVSCGQARQVGGYSPAYDLNPVPIDIKPRMLTTTIDLEDGTASLKLAYDVAPYFELTAEDARGIAREVGNAVTSWRKEAALLGLRNTEIDRMASAFDHGDLRAAAG